MCGISAILGLASDPAQDLAALAAMHAQLRHRGPDGEGCLLTSRDLTAHSFPTVPTTEATSEFGPTAAFAFRWLKVQDLAPSAAQPMCSEDRRVWLLFNGEVYNFSELRTELAGLGHAFRTESDTEVILAAYRQWQHRCFERFNGMWAMVVVDLDRRCVSISRDRLGVKPLFYALEKGRLILASESAAVATGLRDKRVNAAQLNEFLQGMPPQTAAQTFFDGVRPVPAGSWCELPLSGPFHSPVFQAYWTLADFSSEPDDKRSPGDVQDEFEELLRDSLRLQVRAQVRVGCLLSGGLDSSTVNVLASQEMAKRGQPAPESFSIVYADPKMSEWPYVQLVLAANALKGHSILMTPESCTATLNDVIASLGRPLLGLDMIAQHLAYRAAHEHGFTVVLDGQGADELLGGLPIYEARMFPPMLRSLQWVRLWRELRLRSRRYGNGMLANLKSYLLAPMFGSAQTRKKQFDWLAPLAAKTSDLEGEEPDPLNRFLQVQVRERNLPTVLEQQDHNSMRHSVESRVPYLDHRLVEFCFRTPGRLKIVDGERKRPLLDTARRYLPPAIVSRKDKRMFVSDHRWLDLRTQFIDELQALTVAPSLPVTAGWEPNGTARFVRSFIDGNHNEQRAVWRILTTCRWLRRFGLDS